MKLHTNLIQKLAFLLIFLSFTCISVNALPDLNVSSYSVDPSPGCIGQQQILIFDVKNIGNAAANNAAAIVTAGGTSTTISGINISAGATKKFIVAVPAFSSGSIMLDPLYSSNYMKAIYSNTSTCSNSYTNTPLKRYTSSALMDRFYSSSGETISGYTYDHNEGKVSTTWVSGTTPWFQFYHTGATSHFYTTKTDQASLQGVLYNNYAYEKIQGYIYTSQVSGTVPLYHLYHQTNIDHFYTISTIEKDNAIANLSFQDKGIEGYVYPNDPLYDLQAVDAWVSGTPTAGQSAIIYYQVFNSKSPVSSYNVAIYVDGVPQGYETKYNIGTGEYATGSLSVTVAASGNHNIKANVNFDNQISETNYSNNNVSKTIYWQSSPAPAPRPAQISNLTPTAGSNISYVLHYEAYPMTYAYKTFVHFKADNDTIIINDDHYPDFAYPYIPTNSQFFTGSDFSYYGRNRTVTIPANFSGRLRMVTGFYNESTPGVNVALRTNYATNIGNNQYLIGEVNVNNNPIDMCVDLGFSGTVQMAMATTTVQEEKMKFPVYIKDCPQEMPISSCPGAGTKPQYSSNCSSLQNSSWYSTVYNGDYNSNCRGDGSHPGDDIRIEYLNITAIAGGEVIQAGPQNPKNLSAGWGNYIIIKHDPSNIPGINYPVFSLYAHLNEIYVEKGEKIEAGRIIGESGDTGVSTGPHLHFQIQKTKDDTGNDLPYIVKNKTSYWPSWGDVSIDDNGEVENNTYNPIQFIYDHRYGPTNLEPGVSVNAVHPDGTLIKTADNPDAAYILENGKKRHIETREYWKARGMKKEEVVWVTNNEFNTYPEGSPLYFPDGTLITYKTKSKKYCQIFMISNEKKREFECSSDSFRKFGFKYKNVLLLNNELVDEIPTDTTPVRFGMDYLPDGTLLYQGVPKIVKDGDGYPFVPTKAMHSYGLYDPESFFDEYKKTSTVHPVTSDVFYLNRETLTYADGTLIQNQSNSELFIISHQQRIKFNSADVFHLMGYRDENIIKLSSEEIAEIPLASNIITVPLSDQNQKPSIQMQISSLSSSSVFMAMSSTIITQDKKYYNPGENISVTYNIDENANLSKIKAVLYDANTDEVKINKTYNTNAKCNRINITLNVPSAVYNLRLIAEYTDGSQVMEELDKSIIVSSCEYMPAPTISGIVPIENSTGNYQISWNKISGAIDYIIFENMISNPGDASEIYDSSTESLIIKDKQEGEEHNYQIMAIGVCSESALSSPAQLKVGDSSETILPSSGGGPPQTYTYYTGNTMGISWQNPWPNETKQVSLSLSYNNSQNLLPITTINQSVTSYSWQIPNTLENISNAKIKVDITNVLQETFVGYSSDNYKIIKNDSTCLSGTNLIINKSGNVKLCANSTITSINISSSNVVIDLNGATITGGIFGSSGYTVDQASADLEGINGSTTKAQIDSVLGTKPMLDNITIINGNFVNCNEGINISFVKNAKIANNTFTNCQSGIIAIAIRSEITSNTINLDSSSPGYAIALGGTDSLISSNTVIGDYENGIGMLGWNLTAQSNTIVNANNGVGMVGFYNSIQGNNISNSKNAVSGIFVLGANISNNRMDMNENGISIVCLDTSNVNGNTIIASSNKAMELKQFLKNKCSKDGNITNNRLIAQTIPAINIMGRYVENDTIVYGNNLTNNTYCESETNCGAIIPPNNTTNQTNTTNNTIVPKTYTIVYVPGELRNISGVIMKQNIENISDWKTTQLQKTNGTYQITFENVSEGEKDFNIEYNVDGIDYTYYAITTQGFSGDIYVNGIKLNCDYTGYYPHPPEYFAANYKIVVDGEGNFTKPPSATKMPACTQLCEPAKLSQRTAWLSNGSMYIPSGAFTGNCYKEKDGINEDLIFNCPTEGKDIKLSEGFDWWQKTVNFTAQNSHSCGLTDTTFNQKFYSATPDMQSHGFSMVYNNSEYNYWLDLNPCHPDVILYIYGPNPWERGHTIMPSNRTTTNPVC